MFMFLFMFMFMLIFYFTFTFVFVFVFVFTYFCVYRGKQHQGERQGKQNAKRLLFKPWRKGRAEFARRVRRAGRQLRSRDAATLYYVYVYYLCLYLCLYFYISSYIFMYLYLYLHIFIGHVMLRHSSSIPANPKLPPAAAKVRG